jgi:hypothetical protein
MVNETIYDPAFDFAGKIFFTNMPFHMRVKFVPFGNDTITGMIIYPNTECIIFKFPILKIIDTISELKKYCEKTTYTPSDNYTGIDIRSVDQRFVMILNQAFHAINARFKLVNKAPSLRSATIFIHVKNYAPSMKLLEHYFEQLPPDRQSMAVQKKLYLDKGVRCFDSGTASFPDFANDMETGMIFVDNINPDDARAIHHAIYVTDHDVDLPGIIDAAFRIISYGVIEPFPFDSKKAYLNAGKQIAIDIIPYLVEKEVLNKEWTDVANRLKRKVKVNRV